MNRISAVWAAGLFLCLTSPSWADLSIMTNLPGKMPLEYKMPSGETRKTEIFPGGKLASGSISSLPETVKTVAVSVKDDMDAPVWSGNVHNNTCNLLYKGSDGKAHINQVGWWVDAGQSHPAAVIVVNLTGESFKLDFFGQGGTKGLQGVAVGPAMDFNTPIRLPQGETVYSVLFRTPQGQELNKTYSAITSGRYLALVKTAEGKYELQEMGYIKSPGKRYE